jgi:uncharacterized protein YaiI (UPF0178 family)
MLTTQLLSMGLRVPLVQGQIQQEQRLQGMLVQRRIQQGQRIQGTLVQGQTQEVICNHIW